MKKPIVIIVVIVALLSALIYYQRPLRVLAYDWGHAILGGLSSGTGVPLKVDSEGQLYVNMTGMTLLYTGANRGGVSTMVSGISHLASVNLAFGIILLDSTNRTFAIAAGETGQEITLVSTSGALKTLVLDLRSAVVGTAYAVNHTGWSSVAFGTAAGSSVTLVWLDDTRGWIITGANDVTITY